MKLPPIYSETYHFTLHLFKRTGNIPKPYRPTLGRKMESAALELVVLLRQCLLTTASAANLNQLIARVDELKVLTQLSYDLKFFSHADFGEISTSLVKIGKMLGGLHKYERQKIVAAYPEC
jgi:hypothetical protein